MTADVTVVKAAVDAAFREEWGRVVATLIRVTGDWDLAEECAQDAFAMALRRWPADGVPRRPGAWLTTAARNRAIDVLRRRAVGAAKLREVAALSESASRTRSGAIPACSARTIASAVERLWIVTRRFAMYFSFEPLPKGPT